MARTDFVDDGTDSKNSIIGLMAVGSTTGDMVERLADSAKPDPANTRRACGWSVLTSHHGQDLFLVTFAWAAAFRGNNTGHGGAHGGPGQGRGRVGGQD